MQINWVRSTLWQNQIQQCIHQNHIFRARLINKYIPIWLVFHANSEYGKAYFLSAAKQTVNLASINLTQLRHCPELPSLSRRTTTNRCRSRAPSLRRQHIRSHCRSLNLKRAERLRQSLFKEAFAGRLVAQDPNDEPASVLLERIT